MQMIDRCLQTIKRQGLSMLLKKIIMKLCLKKKTYINNYLHLIKGHRGLEIGGPSFSIFDTNGILPLYASVGSLDSCNFSHHTVWEGRLETGEYFKYDQNKPAGRQILCDAVDLFDIDSSTYDFVLASHVLEHIANPIKALKEWSRILKSKGTMVLLLPAKELTFDHKRSITSLEHIYHDFDHDIKEDDLTHLDEILELHDLSRDMDAGSFLEFKKRSLVNYTNRCLHHHVFDINLISQILESLDMKILSKEIINNYHISIVVRKKT